MTRVVAESGYVLEHNEVETRSSPGGQSPWAGEIRAGPLETQTSEAGRFINRRLTQTGVASTKRRACNLYLATAGLIQDFYQYPDVRVPAVP